MLAQVDPTKAIAEGLGANFLPYALALVLLALVFVVRAFMTQGAEHRAELKAIAVAAEARDKAHAEALALAHNERLVDMKNDAKEQREILSQIVPLAAKLTEGLEILERLTQVRE